ncbi:DNA gyrase/topoisomerase IV subunit A [Nakamurella flavida]|nr:DNA gyrase/topoisomerase IV subunit A [Nakamurella flavida]
MLNPDEVEIAAETIRRQLHIRTALLTSLARSDEVLAVIKGCRDQDEATRAVQDLLGLEKIQAHAVLFQQWVGLTSQRAEGLSAEIEADRRELASLTN